jgi:hypothetical protein
MKICNSCGVQLDDSLLVCPLCGRDPGDHSGSDVKVGNTPNEIIEIHRKEQANHLWELSGIIAFSAICVCTIVDLLVGPGLRWSLYADTSCLAIWIMFTLLHFRSVRPVARAIAFMLTVILTLFFYSLFSVSDWFLPLALPISVSLFFCGSIVVFFMKKLRFTGFNLLGVSFFAIAVFCILTEIIIDLNNNGTVNIHWSLITATSILPLSLLFFFMHYRLKKGNRLDSFFHV